MTNAYKGKSNPFIQSSDLAAHLEKLFKLQPNVSACYSIYSVNSCHLLYYIGDHKYKQKRWGVQNQSPSSS